MTSAADRTDLVGLPPQEARNRIDSHFAERRQPAYRVDQVLRWLYHRPVTAFEEMTDLPQAERAGLEEAFDLTRLEEERVSRSSDGTAKHLWRLGDGELIESVLIPTEKRLTLCI